MDFLINLGAKVSGLWKKVASVLPLVAGAGSVLVGAGNILLNLAHSGSAAAALHTIQALSASDPNIVMISAGLVALGIHTNHQSNVAAINAPDAQAGPNPAKP